MPVTPLSVGFDLDMTLIDTVPGFGAVLEALGAELDVDFPVADMTSRLGPPLDLLLGPHLAAEAITPAVDRFRELYPDHAITTVPVLPGAAEALGAVRRHGGRVVVVTGKYTPNARRHLDHLGLDHDVLAGEVWGVGKGDVLAREGCSIYVGDHVHDVEGALAAGATSVSVLTGGCTREELEAAGTHVVLDDLGAFPDWLAGHVLDQRVAALEADLRERGSLMVAYSGGADSALLLAAAVRVLGADRVVAATGYSHSLPQSERDPAREFAESLGVRVLTPETREMDREGYRANAGDRCFFCKAELLDVLTPLADAGLTKADVRAVSHAWGLPTWDKPQAACLSSRIAYGIEVSPHRLARVERAEAGVRRVATALGLPVRDLRVRDLGDRASLELDAALLPLAPDVEATLLAEVRAAGFDEAEVDRRGFRSGSLNALL